MRRRLGSRRDHGYGSGLPLQPCHRHDQPGCCSLAAGMVNCSARWLHHLPEQALHPGRIRHPRRGCDKPIWEFTPTTNVWVQKATVLPVARGYIPTTTIGTLIYTGGGAAIAAGLITDATESFVYNPVADSISPIANIPRATGETRALNVNSQMWVMGGGRTAPNPSNEVDIYDPVAGTWSIGTPFATARRNFPTDTDGSCRVWLAGGYAPTTPTDSMEIFCCGGGPSPTPTATGTPSATPTCPPGGSPGPWTQAAPVTIDHYGGFMDSNGTVAWEGGGYSFSAAGNIDQFGRFDPVANTWTPLAPVPDLNNAMASGVYAPNVNKLFVFGGENIATATMVNTTRIYDITTNTWRYRSADA